MLKLAVIGSPIEHSLSPLVHSAILNSIDVPYSYDKIKVDKGGLSEFIDYAVENDIDGFNLTMPHKEDIIPFLAEIDKEAEAFSSVNTVCIREGKLYGHNTDAMGYRKSLEKCGHSFKNSNIVLLGAGGVVKTLAMAAAIDGARSITILNRTQSKAEEICNKLRTYDSTVNYGGFSKSEIEWYCEKADILINATPLGMSGVDADFGDLSFIEVLPKSALVSDLIYNPEMTRFLKTAEKNGNKTLNGLGMLIYQAIFADEYYLDMKLKVDEIYPIVKRAYEMK